MSSDLPHELRTGIPSIDDQHRAIIRWARAVNTITADETNRTVVLRAAQFLISYARYHFDAEEYAMVASGYGAIAQHRREHSMMRRQLSEISRSIDNENDSPNGSLEPLQKLVQDWLRNHISTTDLAFARFCEAQPRARKVELPSPQQLRSSGSQVKNIDQVEVVHESGAITIGKLKARLKIRD